MNAETKIRCGDTVHHVPSDERWIVAFADYETGDLAYCGWPEGLARISDCALVAAASDAEHARLVDKVIASGGMRGRRAQRLYQPIDTADAIVATPAFRAFSNAIRAFHNIDADVLLATGALRSMGDWEVYRADPYRYFIRADTKRAAGIWTAIQGRMPADPQALQGES